MRDTTAQHIILYWLRDRPNSPPPFAKILRCVPGAQLIIEIADGLRRGHAGDEYHGKPRLDQVKFIAHWPGRCVDAQALEPLPRLGPPDRRPQSWIVSS